MSCWLLPLAAARKEGQRLGGYHCHLCSGNNSPVNVLARPGGFRNEVSSILSLCAIRVPYRVRGGGGLKGAGDGPHEASLSGIRGETAIRPYTMGLVMNSKEGVQVADNAHHVLGTRDDCHKRAARYAADVTSQGSNGRMLARIIMRRASGGRREREREISEVDRLDKKGSQQSHGSG